MDEEFYKKFLDYLVEEIQGLWYNTYTGEDYTTQEQSTFHSWGYVSQGFGENEIENQYGYKSYKELVEDIAPYLRIKG